MYSGNGARQRTIYWLGYALIIAACVCVYSNSFSDAFVLDDYKWIVDNVGIRRLSATWAALSQTARPVLITSLALNHWISGLNVWSYHAFNLAVHLGSAQVLMAVVRRTLQLPRLAATFGKDATVLATVIALLWVIHPLQTESVTYVIQRSESLMGLFYLLTLYFTIRGASSARPGPWYLCSVVACALAIATKPIAVTAPLVVLIYDRLFLARSWHELFHPRWPLYTGLAASWIWLFWLLRSAPPAEWKDTAGSAQAGIPATVYVLTEPGVIIRYLRLSVWPWPLSLEYDWALPTSLWTVLPSLTILVGAVLITVVLTYRQVAASFLAVWFLVILFPTSSVIPISDVIAEHRMYLPLAAVIAALVFIGYGCYRRLVTRRPSISGSARTIAVMLIVVTSCGLGYGTYRRNADYSTAVAVLSDAVKKHPANARAQINLAALLANDGRLDEAVLHLQTAIAIKPDAAEAYANLGVIEYRRNQIGSAIADYRKSLTLDPNAAATHDRLGAALVEAGDIQQAVSEGQRAIQLNPELSDAHYNLGLALAHAGRLDEATAQWNRLLELEPGSARAYKCLAIASLRSGDFADAAHQFELAVAASPADADSSARLAWLLATSSYPPVRNGARALVVSKRANEIAKGLDVDVLRALAASYAETGQYGQAVQTAAQAITLATKSGNQAEVNQLQREKNSYEQSKPWREMIVTEPATKR